MPVRINGATSGSVTLDAPATGSNVTLTLPGVTDTLMRQGGGKILQIVRATDGTLRSTTSTSMVDVTGMSVTITPQRSDSAILILANFSATPTTSSAVNSYGIVGLADSSNNLLLGGNGEALIGLDTSATTSRHVVTLIGRSTPATTSATTYKLRFRVDSSLVTINIDNSRINGQMYAIEVSA